MMAGPQIMAAIIFVTAPKALRVSLPFLAGVAIATTVGVIITTTIASLLGNSISLGDSSDAGSIGHIVQYLLVALLVALAIKNYVRRETVEPPGWLGTLQSADARRAFITGLLIILLMPSDIIVMLTVGVNLVQNNVGLLAALPFIAATVLVAALPLLFFLVFHRRAERLMPKVRDWMNTHSWVVNIIVCIVFIALILL
jgi:threonine/homoserine/homoserine lactone efflux protein